ncbi:MAG: M48 family metalloprotease [Bacteroidales bacterium]|nr:M48 family metalloprotease [Bacteroidales bacterium]
MKTRPLFTLVLAVLLACSCSTLSRINWDYGHLANAGGTALAAVSITDEQISELCRQSVAYTDANTPMADAKYMQRLQKLMAGVTEIDGKPLNFKVYQSNEVNACAYGDGSVRVNSALMDLMDDDELFAVIGHELGHVVHKDSMKAMKRAYLGSAAREAIFAAGGYGQLAGTVLGDISQAYVNAQFSQSQESNADAFGFQFAIDNGHDPYSMARSLEKLNSLSGGGQSSALAKMFSSHPDSAKRAAKMRKKADKLTGQDTTTQK